MRWLPFHPMHPARQFRRLFCRISLQTKVIPAARALVSVPTYKPVFSHVVLADNHRVFKSKSISFTYEDSGVNLAQLTISINQ